MKSLVVQAGHPLADPFKGLHHVYVNPAGKEAIKAGKTPLPEGFFSDPDKPNPSRDQVELNRQIGCLGRLLFHVPRGIKTGKHWLKVKFVQSKVHVPFRIFTEDEAKEFSKTLKDLKEEHYVATKEKLAEPK